MKALKKVYRYAKMYDINRALVKVLGRLRRPFPIYLLLAPLKSSKAKDIAVIGCGQFAFSTIAFFLTKQFGRRIAACFDIDASAVTSFAKAYGVPHYGSNTVASLDLEGVRLVYIASNHASHTDYAVFCLNKGISVYIEKPISVSMRQLSVLKQAVQDSPAPLYFGYNRPFSSAVQTLVSRATAGIFTLNCTVMGHIIAADHWYRKPEEGTRVCGNLGHWIDLAVHLFYVTNSLFKKINITIAYADTQNSDDNLTVILTTERGDLVTLTLTAREEPFEGIHELIIFQQEDLFVKIDDFRRAVFYQGSKKQVKKYKPKDVGHEQAVLQPFNLHHQRNPEEVFFSTELMLHIMDMVKQKETNSLFYQGQYRETHEANSARLNTRQHAAS